MSLNDPKKAEENVSIPAPPKIDINDYNPPRYPSDWKKTDAALNARTQEELNKATSGMTPEELVDVREMMQHRLRRVSNNPGPLGPSIRGVNTTGRGRRCW